MSITATINAVPVFFRQGTLEIENTVTGRGVAHFVVPSKGGAYRPDRAKEVIIERNSLRVFNGYTEVIEESGIGGEPLADIDNIVDCVDNRAIPDWKVVLNYVVPDGSTLKDVFTFLVDNYLDDYGVTLSGSQANGPVLPNGLAYDARTAGSILDEVCQIAGGYIWTLGYTKVLRGFLPGDIAAPFDVVDGQDRLIGDVVVEPSQTDPATRVIVRYGQGTREIIDHFVGDGSTTAFTINYFPLIAHRGYVNVGGTLASGNVTGGANETFSIGGGGTWDYDPATKIVTRLTAVPLGVDVYFIYTTQFPATVIADSAVTPVRDAVFDYPEVFEKAAAQAIADDILLGIGANPRIIRYSTFDVGLEAGQQQHVEVPKRNFDEDVLITDVIFNHLERDEVRYDIVAIEGVKLQHTWKDTIREWSEFGAGSSAPAAPATIGQGGSPGGVDGSVQFNDNGTFGGDDTFKYTKSITRSFSVGALSSIDATSPDSCIAIGYDAHVSDP